MKSESLDPFVKQLSLYGQIAEHKSQMLCLHETDESAVLYALTAEQKDELGRLLTTLQKHWLDDHAAHRQNR